LLWPQIVRDAAIAVNIIAGHYGTAHYNVTCPTFDSDDRLKEFDLSSDNDEELPTVESISVCHPAAFCYRLSEKMGVRFDKALTYVLAEILSPLRKRLTLYTRRARNCEMAEKDGHAVRAGYGNNGDERLWSKVGGEYSDMPLSYRNAVSEGQCILGRMGYAAVIANIMEAHDCSEEEARSIFGQWGYEAVIANIMAECNCTYERAKSIFGRRGYDARIANIIATVGCSEEEARTIIGYALVMYAREQLKEMGIEVREGDNVLSIYQKELMALGVHPWQVYAREQLMKMKIPIPEGADVLSLYQSIVQKQKMEDGKHNFQVYAANMLAHAANMLAMMGVKVREGDNVLSMYQKELMALGVHPWQVYAREQLMKMKIPIPEGADVLSLYKSIVQKQKMVDGTNPFQAHAANMLVMMGVEVREGDNVLSIFQKALLDLSLHPFQNLSEDQIDKNVINMRLSKMSNALPEWKTNFDKLCKWPANAKPPTQRSCKWLWSQKDKRTQGIQSKVDFEALHNTEEWRNQWNSKNQANITGTEWKDNHAKLKKLMKDKKWDIVV
jgi:hypothetical protein